MIGYWLVMGILACALVAVAVAVAASRGAPHHSLLVAPDPPGPPVAPDRAAPGGVAGSQSSDPPIGDARIWVALGATVPASGSGDGDDPSWVAIVAASLPAPTIVHDLSVPGSTLVEARRDQLPTALALAPDLITVWFAASDLLQEIRLGSHERDLDALLAACAAPGREVVVANVPELPGTTVPVDGDDDDPSAVVSRWNAAVARTAAAHGATLADLHGGNLVLSPSDVAIGEIRLSRRGQRALADCVRPAVVAALARLGPVAERRATPANESTTHASRREDPSISRSPSP